MSLRHILLGALVEPASGYDLKQAFNDGLNLFWSAELSQIYPELNKLEAAGLVSSRREPSQKGPPRRVYRRTEAGTDELESWLLQGPQLAGERNATIAQVFFLNSLKPGARIDFLQRLQTSLRHKLDALNQIESDLATNNPRFPNRLPDEDLTKHFALIAGQRRMTMMIDWCDDCIERLQAQRSAGELQVVS